MNRSGTFISLAICASLVSISGQAIAGKSNTKEIKGVDFSAITASIFKSSIKKETVGSKYPRLINTYARKHGVPTTLARAIVRVESNFNPKARGRLEKLA